MLECSSQLYRGIVPIQPWLYYFMEAYQGSEKVIGVIFSLAYVVSKGTEIIVRANHFMKAFLKLLRNVVNIFLYEWLIIFMNNCFTNLPYITEFRSTPKQRTIRHSRLSMSNLS